MNERIRQLLEQTDIPLFPLFENQPPAWVASDYGMEKFAELIVKECLDIAEQTHQTSTGKMRCANDDETVRLIKERFGVKQ